MSLKITSLFRGKGTKRLVVSYKEGSDFDLVLQQLHQEKQDGKNPTNISELVRTLVVATHGCEVFKSCPQVKPPQYERFCIEALGVISGYREVVRGYLSLLGARVTESESNVERLSSSTVSSPTTEESTKSSQSKSNRSETISKPRELTFINSILPK